jgi:hypothetical protein
MILCVNLNFDRQNMGCGIGDGSSLILAIPGNAEGYFLAVLFIVMILCF